MAAPPARAQADYDYLIKLLLIGDSGECPLDLPPCRSSRGIGGWVGGVRVADPARAGRSRIRVIDPGSVLSSVGDEMLASWPRWQPA
jgi:hypothetical protein